MKTLDDYLKLSYTVVLRKDDEGDFIARVHELPGCIAHGTTPEEALTALNDVQKEWIADAIERRHSVPEPSSEDELPSGKWLQRVPRTLHAKLVQRAKEEGVSLNLWVSTILAEACGSRSKGNAPTQSRGEGGEAFFKLSSKYFAQPETSSQFAVSTATKASSSKVN